MPQLKEKYGEEISPYVELIKTLDEFIYRSNIEQLTIIPNWISEFTGSDYVESRVTFTYGIIDTIHMAKVEIPQGGSVDLSDYWDDIYSILTKSDIRFNIINHHVCGDWYISSSMTLVFETDDDMLTACLMINA